MKFTGYILIFALCVILPDKFIAANDEGEEEQLIVEINKMIQELIPTSKKVREEVQQITNEHQNIEEVHKIIQSISDNAIKKFFSALEETITESKVNYGDALKHFKDLQTKRTAQIQKYVDRVLECAKEKKVEDVSYESVFKCNDRHRKMILEQLKDTVTVLKQLQKQIYSSKTRVQDCLGLLKITDDEKANKDSISQTCFCLGQIAPELASNSGRICASTAVQLRLTEKFMKQAENFLLHCYANNIFETEKLLKDRDFDVKECAKKQEKQPE